MEHAETHPQRLAICFKDQKLTYEQLAERTRVFVAFLQKREQVKSGDIIMINALSKPEYAAVWLAVQYFCATVMPVDKSSLEESVIWLYHFVEPKFILIDSRIRDESVYKPKNRKIFVIVTSDKITAKEALHIYKSWDMSEKAFCGDKTYLGDNSLCVHSAESISAKIFTERVGKDRAYKTV